MVDKKIDVFYLGIVGYHNYGDDFGKLLIETNGFVHKEDAKVLLIGVGTLFPLNKDLQKRINDKSFNEIIVFGTGCVDRRFEKDKAQYDDDMKFTKKLLEKAKFIGVRDEFTAKMLGVGEVIGDPFFSVATAVKKKEKYVVLNMGRCGYNCWGGLDGQLDTLKSVLKFTKNFIMKELGLDVKVLSLFVNDNSQSCDMINYLGCEGKDFHNLNVVTDLFANAEFCITYKLHGMITALMTNTPVIALEYKPKVRNVGKDFGIEKFILRTDEVTEESLLEKYKLLSEWDSDFINKKHDEYAKKQFNAVEEIKKILGEK